MQRTKHAVSSCVNRNFAIQNRKESSKDAYSHRKKFDRQKDGIFGLNLIRVPTLKSFESKSTGQGTHRDLQALTSGPQRAVKERHRISQMSPGIRALSNAVLRIKFLEYDAQPCRRTMVSAADSTGQAM